MEFIVLSILELWGAAVMTKTEKGSLKDMKHYRMFKDIE